MGNLEYQVKKIVILGSSGYIGSYLTNNLKNNHKVISHSRKKINNKVFNKNLYNRIYGDLKNKKTINKILKLRPDVIIYTISLNHKDSEKNINYSIKNNYIPLLNLICEIIKNNISTKIIYLSTMQVYGRSYNKYLIDENYKKNIENIYSLTHSMCEELLYVFGDTIKSHSLRISNTFGMPVLKNIDCWWLVINDFCKSAIERNKIIINSDGTSLRDFVSLTIVKNVVNKLISKNYRIPFLNVCSGNTYSIKEIAQKISLNPFFKKNLKIEIKKKTNKKLKKYKYDNKILKKLSIKSQSIDEEINIFLKKLSKK